MRWRGLLRAGSGCGSGCGGGNGNAAARAPGGPLRTGAACATGGCLHTVPARAAGRRWHHRVPTRKHHVQEVLCVVEVVAGVDDGLADGGLVRHGRQGGHLGNQAVAGAQLLLGVPARGGGQGGGRGRCQPRRACAACSQVKVEPARPGRQQAAPYASLNANGAKPGGRAPAATVSGGAGVRSLLPLLPQSGLQGSPGAHLTSATSG